MECCLISVQKFVNWSHFAQSKKIKKYTYLIVKANELNPSINLSKNKFLIVFSNKSSFPPIKYKTLIDQKLNC